MEQIDIKISASTSGNLGFRLTLWTCTEARKGFAPSGYYSDEEFHREMTSRYYRCETLFEWAPEGGPVVKDVISGSNSDAAG